MRATALVGVALSAMLFAGIASHPVVAVEKILQNDAFPGSGSVICVSGQSFFEEEIAAARFTPDPGDYPLQILEIQVLACPQGAQGELALKIWQDDGVSNQPGNLLHEEAFTLLGSDVALNALDVSSLGLVVNSGSIRIGFEYLPLPTLMGFATDMDGHVVPQQNFIYAVSGPLVGWWPADLFGVNNDWIIRVRVDASSEPPLFADGFESGDTTAWSATVQ